MRIVLMGGSLRPDSLNLRLLGHLVADLAARGHAVASFAGEALRLPLYEQDLAVPEGVQALHAALMDAQGVVIVSPEYNAGIPGHMKNAVDWPSTLRPNPWQGLPVLLCAASPGALGGARGLVPWRLTLANMGALVCPDAITVPHADHQLDGAGAPTDPRTAGHMAKALDSFLALAARLRPGLED
jgi:NAD(P)H-dependent FMN reductase